MKSIGDVLYRIRKKVWSHNDTLSLKRIISIRLEVDCYNNIKNKEKQLEVFYENTLFLEQFFKK